jgi:riboflavin kinase/FMN adenylyltransferase
MNVFRNIDELQQFNNAVITIGTFDGVHLGHQQIISRINQIAKDNAGESVIITFHPHPRLVIQPDGQAVQLLSTPNEKIELLKKYGVNNVVIIPFSRDFSEQSAEHYIEHFLVKISNRNILLSATTTNSEEIEKGTSRYWKNTNHNSDTP